MARFHSFVGVLLAVCAVGNMAVVAKAQSPTTVAPTRFLGRPFTLCTKFLGKARTVRNPNVDYGAYSRYHNSPVRSIAGIVLCSDHKTAVESVTYLLTKGKYNGVSACRLLGIKAKKFKGGIHVTSDEYAVEWEPATADGSHPAQDWLTFFAL